MQPYYQDDLITIYHGDCRDVLPLLCPYISQNTLLLSDPPYGVKERTDRKSKGRSNATDSLDFAPIVGDDEPFDPAHLLALNVPTVLWGANHYADRLPASPSWWVWDKRAGTTPDDNADCEMAWTNIGGPARLYTHLWRGMIKASERDARRVHPTQKPVALMRWCLQRAKVRPETIVIDPYMGSGPTLRAALDLGVRSVGVEIDERYCEAAARRLAQSAIIFDEAA